MPGAGDLRELVTFQRREAADDGMGNTVDAWASIPNAIGLPARVKPVRQAEAVNAEGVSGRADFLVTLRFSLVVAGVNVGDRMVDARTGARYNVKGPPQNMDERRRYLQIPVQAGGADG